MTIEIIQNDHWQRIPPPEYEEDIVSGGMGPCVSIFVHDGVTKVTYGCHYSDPVVQHAEKIELMLDEALDEFIGSPQIKVFVSGAIDSCSESYEKRQFVTNLIKSKFGTTAQIELRWPKEGAESVELVFEPLAGILHEPKL